MSSQPLVWFLVVGVLLIVIGAGIWGMVRTVPAVMVVIGAILLLISIIALFVAMS